MNIALRGLVDRRIFLGYILPALVITAGLQTLRVFFPSLAWYLKDTVGLPSTSLAIYALLTFLVGFLAAVLWRLLGPRRSLWLTAGGVALVRLAEQLVSSPPVDLWLSLIGTALFALFLPVWFGHLRAQRGLEAGPRWAFGLWLGLSLDTAIKGANGTLDLSWTPGLWTTGTTILLVALIFWSLRREPFSAGRPVSENGWGDALALFGLGPFLLIQALIFQNLGWTAEVAGLQAQLAFLMVMIGNLLAILGAIWGFSRPYTFRYLLAFVVLAYLGIAISSADQPGAAFLVILGIGQFLMGWAWSVIASLNSSGDRPGLTPTTVSLGVGLLFFVLLAFVYYASMDINLGIPRDAIPPLSGVLFGLAVVWGISRVQQQGRTPWADRTALTCGIALLALPLATMIALGGAPATHAPTGSPVTVMTYNIHSAYSAAGRQDPEAIAQAIEASGADIVTLNEVSRGWLIDGSTDLVFWLSRRLDMPILFKGTEDPVWGNAILTRDPVLQTGSGPLPLSHTLIARGYLWARVDVGGPEPLLVITTHLHQLEAEHDVRLLQVPVLVDLWGERPFSLVMGDMNSQPGDPEMDLFSQAGLVDSWQQAGEGDGLTFSSTNPFERIDWIWHTPDMRAVSAEVPATTASDHRPAVTTLEIGP
jgi:endonuclease/exonuclease/phosphatase family metal-dependent hydrolase